MSNVLLLALMIALAISVYRLITKPRPKVLEFFEDGRDEYTDTF